jgi:hypothetical protein
MTTEARDLVAAYTRRLTTAGCPDADALARELVVIAQGHDWRHVPAVARHDRDAPPANPDVAAECVEAIRRQLRGDTT